MIRPSTVSFSILIISNVIFPFMHVITKTIRVFNTAGFNHFRDCNIVTVSRSLMITSVGIFIRTSHGIVDSNCFDGRQYQLVCCKFTVLIETMKSMFECVDLAYGCLKHLESI